MAKLSEAKDVSPFQVILKAKLPERKSKPARAKIVILATSAAFIFSLPLALLTERFAGMPDGDLERWKSLAAVLPFLRNREVG